MDIARVRVVTTGYAGAPGLSTFYFRNSSGSSWSAIPNQIIAIVAGAYAAWAAFCPTTWTAEVQGEIDVINAESGLIVQTITGTPVSHTGTATGGYAALATGLLVRYHTAGIVNGKRVKGGTFLVPLDITNQEGDGSPTSTCLTGGVAFGTAVSASGTYGKLVVYSRKNAHESTGSAYDVTTVSVKDKFAVLRSRRD